MIIARKTKSWEPPPRRRSDQPTLPGTILSSPETQVKTPNKRHSLVLKRGSKVIFSSSASGLKPLVECIARFQGTIKNADLEDRVVGIAAARLIVFSQMVSRVRAGLISEKALHHLGFHGIPSSGRKRVARILAPNQKDPCPMEKLSRKYPDDGDFFSALLREFQLAGKSRRAKNTLIRQGFQKL